MTTFHRSTPLVRRLLIPVWPLKFTVEVRGESHRGPDGWGRLRLICQGQVYASKLIRLKACGTNCLRLSLPQSQVPRGRYQLDMLVFCCRKGTGTAVGSFEVELATAADGTSTIMVRQVEGNQP